MKRTTKKKKKFKLPKPRIGCPFCWEWLPNPVLMTEVFSGGGTRGGRCECGAVFVVDDTGKAGGQALMDAQALACDGDLDRAAAIQEGVDFELKTKAFQAMSDPFSRPLPGHAYLEPKIWSIKMSS